MTTISLFKKLIKIADDVWIEIHYCDNGDFDGENSVFENHSIIAASGQTPYVETKLSFFPTTFNKKQLNQAAKELNKKPSKRQILMLQKKLKEEREKNVNT